MKPKIVVTRKIPQQALELLERTASLYVWEKEDKVMPRELLLKEIKDAHGLYSMLADRIDTEVMDAAPHLRVISTMAVGYDNIDIAEATKRGIRVGHTPDVLTEATADLAFALLMATARRLGEGMACIKEGKWKNWSPMFMAGQEVYGSTLGIIGMGRIGEGVARRAKAFDMRILYHNRTRRLEAEEKLGAVYCSLEELLDESDHVVLLTPATKETYYMMGAAQFARMKRTATFINVSRGTNVDEDALYRALVNKEIWAAGLDVFEKEPIPPSHPLLSLDNVVALPHIGSATVQTRLRMAMVAAENVLLGVKGERLRYTANPDVYASLL
ncbi:D-glycerate dehydrogenase [Aneurinibacillus thermoaerophilus]|uniref:Lactate dehydrogenase n=1 Tax=Aneurinibacillus thermoaerophilus TaxID=143495 RepID=A0A1G7YPN0_ANETH|nr:D-glycerate dehydrogenase [Aneurinibacillus thermoaerophilus]MED0756445.1 D-glycerate dehydrogenase [Aneurinibacillus thermoaerophilus]MED0761156.1 D-glycerate dehydrogenase [Aneurinibacillus thermoaerophilus]SDG98266.1 Lactate dehydrogenase [Aneurinibacillus thermoaerophilus]